MNNEDKSHSGTPSDYIIDTIPYPVFEVNDDCVILLANKEAKDRWSDIVDGESRYDEIIYGRRLTKEDCAVCRTFESEGSRTEEITTSQDEVFQIKTNLIRRDGYRVVVVHLIDITEKKRVEEELKESENKYRYLYEESNFANLVIGVDGRLKDVNRAFVEMMGYEKDEVIGRRILDFVTPEDRKKVIEYIEHDFKGEPTPSDEFNVMAKDGSVHTILFSPGSALMHKDGEPESILVSGIDITEKKVIKRERDEHQIIAEETRRDLEAIFDNVDILFWYVREREDGYLYYEKVNEAFSSVTGKTPEDYNGKRVIDLGEGYEEIRERYDRMKREKVIQTYDRVVDDGEKEFFIRLIPIIEPDGDVRRFIGSAVDTTYRREREEELKRSEEKFHNLFRYANDAIFVESLEGEVLAVNRKACELHNYTAEEMLDLRVSDLVPEEVLDTLPEIDELLATEGGFMVEAKGKRKDGSVFPTEVSGRVVPWDEDEAVLVFMRDITDRKRAEQVESILYNIANSVNTKDNLDELYKIIHDNLNTIIDTSNIYIALYDEEKDMLKFPYFVDEKDYFTEVPAEKTVTHYVIRTEQPLLATPEVFERLHKRGEIYERGVGTPAENWLGVPLKRRGEVFGVVAVQSYTDSNAYDEGDKELLQFVSDQIAIAIDEMRAQEALRESEEKYRILVETSPDAVTSTDLEGKITYVSKRTLELHNYDSEEELMGKPAFILIAEEDRERAKDNMIVTLEDGYLKNIEYELLRKDGSTFTGLISASLIRDLEGEPKAFIATTRDITERKEVEMALRESEEKYRSVVEGSNDGIVIIKDGILKYANRKAEEITGYKLEKVLDKSIEKFIHPDELDRVMDIYMKRMRGEKVPGRYETALLHKDGNKVDIDFSVSLINYQGETAELGFIRDITVRKRMERELRESEELYRTLFEATGSATAIDDADTTLLLVNSEYAELVGYSKEEIEGKMSWKNFIHEKDLERVLKYHNDRRVDEESAPTEYEMRFVDMDGEIHYCYVITNMIPGTQKTVASIIDITDLKKAEESIRESEERFRGLFDTTHVISRATEFDEMIEVIGDEATRLIGANECTVFLLDEDGDVLMPVYYNGEEYDDEVMEFRLLIGEGLSGYVALTGQSSISNYDGTKDVSKQIPGTPEEEDESLMSVPLEVKGEVVGVMTLRNYERVKFTEDDLETISAFAGQASLALEKAWMIRDLKKTTEELSASEEKYRSLVENINVGIYRNTPGEEGRFIDVNPAMFEMFGYDNKSEFMNITVADLYADRDKRRITNEKLIKDGYLIEEELLLKKKSGETFWGAVTARAVHNESGEVMFYDGIVQDITDRKKAEKNLEEQKAHFQELFMGSPEAIVILDNDHRVTSINTEFVKLFQYTLDDLEGENIDDFIVPDYLMDEGKELTKKVLNIEDVSIETIRKRKDGSLVDVSILGTPIIIDGEQAGVYGIYRDITERKVAQDRIENLSEIHHLVAESLIKAQTVSELTQSILTGLKDILDFDIGEINLSTGFRQRGEEVARVGAIKELDECLIEVQDEIGLDKIKSPSYEAKLENRPIFTEDAKTDELTSYAHSCLEKSDINQIFTLPLNVWGRKSGVLQIMTRGPKVIKKNEREVLEIVSKEISAGIEKVLAEETIEKERRTLQLIAELAVRDVGKTELCQIFAESMLVILGFDFGGVRLYDPQEEILLPTSIVGIPDDIYEEMVRPEPLDGEICMASLIAREKVEVFAPDVRNHPIYKTHRDRIEELGIRAMVSYPLLGLGDRLLGVVHLMSGEPIIMSDEDRGFYKSVVGMFTNILERVETRDELEKSRERFRDLFEFNRDMLESSPIGVLRFDSDFKIIYENPAMERILGVPEGEESNAMGVDIRRLTSVEETGLGAKFDDFRKGEEISFETPFTSIYGVESYLSVVGVPLYEGGQFSGGMLMIRNILEQKKAEERIIALSEIHKLVAHAVNRYETVEELCQEILTGLGKKLDMSAGEILLYDEGSDKFEWFAEWGISELEDRREKTEEFTTVARLTLQRGEPIFVEDLRTSEYTSYAREIFVEFDMNSLYSVPLEVRGNFIGVLQLMTTGDTIISEEDRDILNNVSNEIAAGITKITAEEELKTAYDDLKVAHEELRKLDNAKTEFLNVTSHELKTPLTSIIGYSELLTGGSLGEMESQQVKALNGIERNTSRLSEMVDELLDFSRMESGKVSLNKVECDMNAYFSEVLEEVKVSLREEVGFYTDIEEGLPSVVCDPRRITQVIQNLINNAVQYSDEEVEVSLTAQVSDDYLLVSVKDTGIGIPEDELDKVFERFYQVDMSDSRRSKGLGLGLSISRTIVEMHGGRIWAESEVGVGSIFHFTIPVR